MDKEPVYTKAQVAAMLKAVQAGHLKEQNEQKHTSVFCTACGKSLTDGEFCSNCGASVGVTAPPVIQPVQTVSHTAKVVSGVGNSVTEDEFKTFVGINAHKFSLIREEALQGKNSWSWAAAFGGPFWAAYYKWWTALIIIYLAYFALGFVISAIALSLLNTSNPDLPGQLHLAILLILGIVQGLTLKSGYVRHAYKKIATLKIYASNSEELNTLLAKKGGTSILGPIAMGILFIFLGVCLGAMSDAYK